DLVGRLPSTPKTVSRNPSKNGVFGCSEEFWGSLTPDATQENRRHPSCAVRASRAKSSSLPTGGTKTKAPGHVDRALIDPNASSVESATAVGTQRVNVMFSQDTS